MAPSSLDRAVWFLEAWLPGVAGDFLFDCAKKGVARQGETGPSTSDSAQP